MADSVKGLTLKIGADTSDFNKALKDADKQIKTTSKMIDALQQSLILEWDDKKFAKMQQLAQKNLEETETKAESLRKQLKYLEDTGQIDTNAYRELQVKLENTENQAKECAKQLKEIDNIKTKNLQKQITDLGGKVESVGKSLSVLSIASAASIAALTKLGLDAVKTGDDIATLSSQYDMSTKAIQKWQYVALQSDVTTETLLKGAKKVKSALAEQLNGTINDSTKALDELDISIEKCGSNEAAFEEVIQSIGELGDVTQQTYYANLIFGENVANELIPLFQQGSAAINSYLNEFEQVGYLSETQVEKLAEFDNEMNMLKTQFSECKTEIGVAFLPVIETFAGILRDDILPLVKEFTAWFDSLSPSMKNCLTILLLLTAAIGPALILVGKFITSLNVLVPLLKKVKIESLKTAAGFASIAGAFALIFDLIGNWKEMSTVEKILKAVAIAALVAAAAMTVFHASATWGIAVGAIVAGIAVGLAAINAAQKEIMGDEANDFDTAEYTSKATSGLDSEDLSIPEGDVASTKGYYNNNVEDNSVTNVYVTVAANEYVSADEIVEVVAEKLALQLQSRG